MAIALSVLFVGTLFALIYLYNITKDRWDWTKLAKIISNIVPLTFASLFFFIALIWFFEKTTRNLSDYLTLIAATSIELFLIRRVTYDRWNWKKITKIILYAIMLLFILLLGFFFYEKITKIYENHQAEAREKREFAARSCNAAEINRIEPLLQQAISSINERTSIQAMHSILSDLNSSALKESNPLNNIKEFVIETSVKPNCESNFRYQLEATFSEDKILNTFKTFAINPPKGYRHFALEIIGNKSKEFGNNDDTYSPIDEFSIDFVATRQAELERLQFLERKKNEAEKEKNRQFSDPCAPNLTRSQRLERLAKFGTIRQVQSDHYTAGGHKIEFFISSGDLLWCE